MIRKHFNYPSSTRETQNGQRVYAVGNEALPSVTTILQATKTLKRNKKLKIGRSE